jgi:predicted anti-sigma-YlaC factor YlaD
MFVRLVLTISSAALLAACSVQRYALRSVGDVLASEASVYESDDDPELIEGALPFGLKLIETLLEEQPEHRGLLLSAASGYVLYSYAFVSLPAERASDVDIGRARELRQRARGLSLRAHAYASRALELDYPGVAQRLSIEPQDAMSAVGRSPARDVPALYWSAAALALAISQSRNEPALLARLPEVEAMLQRAIDLDESWNAGALHELAINLSAASMNPPPQPTELENHYRRGVELSGGHRASLHVTYAETVTVPRQERDRFVELMQLALAVDVDAVPKERLLNVIAKRRAEWLLGRIDDLFL